MGGAHVGKWRLIPGPDSSPRYHTWAVLAPAAREGTDRPITKHHRFIPTMGSEREKTEQYIIEAEIGTLFL